MSKVNLRKVAVFDIDGTIFRSSLLRELLENLISAGVLPEKTKKFYARSYIEWLNRRGSYEKYIMNIVKAYESSIGGIRRKIVWDVAGRVINFQKDRVYTYTRGLISELRKKNYYLLAISGSPVEVVRPFARKIGFNKVYGRVFEVDKNQRFTGRILFEDLIDKKGEVLMRAIRKENLTLKNSIGVGDTDYDIPFLKLVERPIAFNPNLKLYRYAKKHKWEIIVERKDVIFKL